jgi:hypothetical protein
LKKPTKNNVRKCRITRVENQIENNTLKLTLHTNQTIITLCTTLKHTKKTKKPRKNENLFKNRFLKVRVGATLRCGHARSRSKIQIRQIRERRSYKSMPCLNRT